LISTRVLLSGRIAVDAIEVSNLRRVGLVAGPALIAHIDGCRGRLLWQQDARGCRAGACKRNTKQVAAADISVEVLLHESTPRSN